MTEIKAGDRVTIDDFGVPRHCVAETMPREALLSHHIAEWTPDRLYLRDEDGRYFPTDTSRPEGTK